MRVLLALLALVACAASAGDAVGVRTVSGAPAFRALVFSKTAGFRHMDTIPTAVGAVRSLGAGHGFAVEATEDAAAFTDENLARFDVVVFLLTTGDVLNEAQQAAFERYIRAGGGWVGVHSASDTEYEWPFYGRLLGAYFNRHPSRQTAAIERADPLHPSTADLPARWVRFDEWYNFRRNPRPFVHVLLTVDESSYAPGPGAMGADHPIAWCQDYGGGRAWYTAIGHTPQTYEDARFLDHLLGGIRYAAGFPRHGTRRGTAGPDVFACLPGNDLVYALAGDDAVAPGRGNDVVYGGFGNDRLQGADGNDLLAGGPGRDRLAGGRGDDRLYGGRGADLISGGPGDDRVFARDGSRDVVACGAGRDRIVADRFDILRAPVCEIIARR